MHLFRFSLEGNFLLNGVTEFVYERERVWVNFEAEFSSIEDRAFIFVLHSIKIKCAQYHHTVDSVTLSRHIFF